LKHKAAFIFAQTDPSIFIEYKDIGAVDTHGVGRRRVQLDQQTQQGRFAGTGCANDCQGRTALYIEIDIIEDQQLAAGVRHVFAEVLDISGRRRLAFAVTGITEEG